MPRSAPAGAPVARLAQSCGTEETKCG